VTLHRLTAFAESPDGGNPAGVWIGDELPEPEIMQRIAAEVACAVTAFVAPATGRERSVRFFSPESEVPSCGHATIATGVVLGGMEGGGVYRFSTAVGVVSVALRRRGALWEASLTSVLPRHEPAPASLVDEALAALNWRREELNASIPPTRIYAGNWHLLMAAATPARLAMLDFDFERLKRVMLADHLTTLQLVWREDAGLYHSRNPIAAGGGIEDPASGSAAAALGGYLRDTGLVNPPARILIRQGEAMGRPSRLIVDIPKRGGIIVTGTAVPIDAGS
jgi:PhzF family phenazine biosynthesis protein